ncbi:MAG: WYL domain-containing protein, partial [Candidatus Accumulibacter sp.]|nr:WYL domain-containing protein [Accumulibacter sp.]
GELAARLRDEDFDVSRRTIERDLHTLSARFPLVLDDRTKPFGWSWARNANFEFMPGLTPSQAVALLLARTHLRDLLPQSMHKELAPLFDTATQALSRSGWKDWHKRTAVVPMGLALIPPKIPPDILPAVQSAIARRHRIDAKYRNKGEKQARATKIHPLGLFSRGSSIYLVCTFFDFDDICTLPLHRFSEVVETNEPAREPKDFDFRKWVDANARHYLSNGPICLVARFEATAAEHLRETPLSADQALKDLEKSGQVEVSATVEDDGLLHWWLLGFGQSVEVLRPQSLRKWLAEEVRGMASQYEG